MQALEGRPNQAISRPSPSSDETLLPRSRQRDGALVTESIDATVLGGHIERLTAHGPRHETNPAAVVVALSDVTSALESYGYRVERECYGGAAHEARCNSGLLEPRHECGMPVRTERVALRETVTRDLGAGDQ